MTVFVPFGVPLPGNAAAGSPERGPMPRIRRMTFRQHAVRL
eukprot:COSAG05_NODE_14461_length_396_cov_0.700337_1_plen_40_part_10